MQGSSATGLYSRPGGCTQWIAAEPRSQEASIQPIQRSEFTEFVADQFSFLTEIHAFDGPRIEQEAWTDRVTYLQGKAGLGIEIHMDWRDLVNQVYVVRLNRGHVPSAFLFERGGPVRLELLALIRERQLDVEPTRLAAVTTRTQWQDRTDPAHHRGELVRLAQLLSECIADILHHRDQLF